MDIRVILRLAAVGVFALALLYKEGLLKKPAPIVIAVMLTALALVLRALVFGYETLDYQKFSDALGGFLPAARRLARAQRAGREL